MSEKNWITVKAPKMLYLPVAASSGAFKDSGQRVEPTDKIELLPGTNRIRINDMDLSLIIPCNNIPVQNGVITLSRPAPPVHIKAEGTGWAVGRTGQAQANARGKWDQQAAEEWKGDAATHAAPMSFQQAKSRIARGGSSSFPIIQSEMESAQTISFHSDRTGDQGFDQAIATQFGLGFEEPDPLFNPSDNEIQTAFDDPTIEIREITLRGGGTAHARFDKRTGKQVGTPFRDYQVRYENNGRQLPAAAPTHGPNATFDMNAHKAQAAEEYHRRIAEQSAAATIAPTAAERWDKEITRKAREMQQAQVIIDQVVAEKQLPHNITIVCPGTPGNPTVTPTVTPTGMPHIDNLVAGRQGVVGGIPLGKITHVYGSAASLLFKTNAKNIANAFGHIHLLKPGQNVVVIELEPESVAPSDNLRLALAEQIPVLSNMINHGQVAIVIITPDWGDAQTPALLRLSVPLRIRIEPHERDERFITATITKHDTNPALNGTTASFPMPKT